MGWEVDVSSQNLTNFSPMLLLYIFLSPVLPPQCLKIQNSRASSLKLNFFSSYDVNNVNEILK